MIQSLKQIKNRIRGIENTQKVTSAMQMISVAKLNRIEKILYTFRPYFLSLETFMNDLVNSSSVPQSPFFEAREGKQDICLCLVTSDGGLCGSYNNNIIRLAGEFIEKKGKEAIKLVCIGKKGFNFFKKRGLDIVNSYIGFNGRYSEKIVDEITSALIDIYLSGKAGEVHIAYTQFETALIHKPAVAKFLNIEPSLGKKIEYIFEPNAERILEELLPKYIQIKMRLMFLGAFCAEHSARTVAMKTATDNANELLRGMILLKNKVRQADITEEMMEIISSSEALKG